MTYAQKIQYSECMLDAFHKEFRYRISIFVFLFYTCWWFILQFAQTTDTTFSELFSDTYGITALIGCFIGMGVGVRWGGRKSKMGRSVLAFAGGLALQAFGQFVYTFYFLTQGIEAAYPSIGDIGYFGSIPFYIYGAVVLADASGIKFSLQKMHNALFAVLLPLGLLAASYYSFLVGYEFDFSEPIRVFLDFAYPLGQAIYISIALVTFLLSRKILGGIMRRKILFILVALVLQYAADYLFLYQQIHETWVAGGVNDYLYLVSYFMMTMALFNIRISDVRAKLVTD